jgi:two-component system, OmpR family, response regulator
MWTAIPAKGDAGWYIMPIMVPDADRERSPQGVLVVEDDTMLLNILAERFGKERDITFSFAATGAEALDKIEKEMPALVLLDILLPDMDGYEILRRLKEGAQAGKHAPRVIVFSNFGQPAEKEKAMNLGAAEFLVKAESPLDEVLASVRRHLAATQPAAA